MLAKWLEIALDCVDCYRADPIDRGPLGVHVEAFFMYTAGPRPFALPVVERRKTVSDNSSLSEVHATLDRESFIAQLYQEVFFGIEQ